MGNLLSLTTFIPLLGLPFWRCSCAAMTTLHSATPNGWRCATTGDVLVSLFILFEFDPADTGFQMVEERTWLLGLNYKMGVDGISILFVMLTTFLMPLVIASCWNVRRASKNT